jgi:glycosyltransferase involved in cell wall biosynthesis
MYESNNLGARLRRRAVAWAARRPSTILAAPSDALAAHIYSSTGRPCTTVRHGVDRSIFHPAESTGEELLCVADFYPHKRHDLVIAAWQGLTPPRPTLRLVGDPDVDRAWHSRILEIVAALDDPSAVEVAGIIEHARMGGVYRRAAALIVASEHESFCLPVAEAMACGVPVLARDIPSLRETAGGGGRFVSGDDEGDWSRGIELVLGRGGGSAPDRATLLAAATRYSWDAAAEALMAAAGCGDGVAAR